MTAIPNEEKTFLEAVRKRERSFWLAAVSLGFGIIYVLDSHFSKVFVYSDLLVFLAAAVLGAAALFFWYLQGTPSITFTQKINPFEKLLEVKGLIFQLDSVVQCIKLYEEPDNKNNKNEIAHIQLLIKDTFNRIRNSSHTKDLNIVEDETLFNSALGRHLLLSRSQQLLVWLNEQANFLMAMEIAGQKEDERSRDRTRLLVDRSHERLSAEVRQLSRRANSYLAVGAVATIIAAGYLYISAPEAIKEFLEINKGRGTSFEPSSLIPLLSRLTIALAIEAFAFYFLKLHREVMSNVKYYQNELTNIDLKAIGLNAAYSPIDGNSLKDVVDVFSKTERNFILGEKQTTVELEKFKLETNSTNEILGKISGLLKRE